MKKTTATLLAVFMLSFFAYAQYIELDHYNTKSNFVAHNTKPAVSGPKLLQSGFVDFLNNGNLQASAKFLQLNIGERDGFHIPLLVYTGVTGQVFGKQKDNNSTIASLLNPVGGIFNSSFCYSKTFSKETESYTKFRFACQFGGRMVNVEDTITKTNSNFFNAFGNAGFLFQTGAWESTSTSTGLFWIQGKAMASYSSKAKLENFFGTYQGNLLYGFMLDGGIEIDGLINLKVSYYKHLNNTSAGVIEKPVFKISLDYKLKQD